MIKTNFTIAQPNNSSTSQFEIRYKYAVIKDKKFIYQAKCALEISTPKNQGQKSLNIFQIFSQKKIGFSCVYEI